MSAKPSAGPSIVRACADAKVQQSGGPGNNIEGCRPNAKPAVQACVAKILSAAIARKGSEGLERRDRRSEQA
jgi:hypothetical protein